MTISRLLVVHPGCGIAHQKYNPVCIKLCITSQAFKLLRPSALTLYWKPWEQDYYTLRLVGSDRAGIDRKSVV